MEKAASGQLAAPNQTSISRIERILAQEYSERKPATLTLIPANFTNESVNYLSLLSCFEFPEP
jgi:hypothetical protein